MHALVIDDDRGVRSLIRRVLEADGFEVDEADDEATVAALTRDHAYGIITLDLGLASGSGLDIARRLRARSNTPIIMVTARSDVMDRVIGLEVGADDYITKPFHVRELLARVHSVLRRVSQKSPPPADAAGEEVFSIGDLRLFAERNLLLAGDGREVRLTACELKCLAALARAGGRALSRDTLLDAIHGSGSGAFDRAVDSLITRLRKKLPDGTIRTARSLGYQIGVPVRRTSAAPPA